MELAEWRWQRTGEADDEERADDFRVRALLLGALLFPLTASARRSPSPLPRGEHPSNRRHHQAEHHG